MASTLLNGRLIVKTGDITNEKVDAIVNAANSTLLGGGGVDGAIHAKGGPEILEACRVIRSIRFPEGLPTGEAVITTAGRLDSRFVIHTVGPIYKAGDPRNAVLLASCYNRSLEVAAENSLQSVAFPSISTGVYRYPKVDAAPVAFKAIATSLEALPSIREVRLVFFSETDAKTFLENAI